MGKDSAANPVEHLLHALASCLTTSMVYHAAARGIHIEEVESTLEGDVDLHGFIDLDKKVRNGYQGIRVNFKVKADVPEGQLHEIVELGSRHSPVFDSLATVCRSRSRLHANESDLAPGVASRDHRSKV